MINRTPEKNKNLSRRGGARRSPWRAAAALLCALCLLTAQAAVLAPDAQAAAGQLRISEVMSANASTLILESGDVPDWIEIENPTSAPIDLTGYVLMRATRPAKAFAFPSGVIQPGQFVVVYCDGSGQGLKGDGYHAPFRLPASGETVSLLDKKGRTVDEVELPSLARDQVYCLDAQGAWQLSDYPTPGERNRVERSEGAESVKPVSVVPGALEISEAMSDNVTFFPDENGQYWDYVEVHNISGAPVNLEGWALSDSQQKLMRWRFPSVTLPAGGYLAVHLSGQDRRSDVQHLHAGFKLNNKGDELYLTNPNGATVAHVKVPLLEADQAYTLLETGWTKSYAPTPGEPNTPAGVDAASARILRDNKMNVFITEVLASSDKSDDWIEIYNGSSDTVDLSGYGLSDNASRPRKWQFPAGTTLAPGAYLGVFANGADSVVEGRIQASYRLSSQGGYSVTLSDPSGAIIDRMFVPAQYQNISYGRTSSQSALRYFTTPTPGAANPADGYYGRAPMPVYSVRGGLYKSGDVLTVTMDVPSDCRIYYTLDYTDPTEASTPYTGPITVEFNTILRTRVYGNGYLESFMDTQSYLYDVNNAGGTVFVVSLVSDPYNLTSDEAGIMVKGPNALPNYPYGSMNKGANFWMDWEREAHVEVFNPDGSTLISQECGIKLHGQYSRAEKQKAFKVIARAEYGSNRFPAAIFSYRPYTEYQSFLLRSSSEDGNKTRMRDALLQLLARDLDVMYQETEVGVLFIDGQYWGHYNLRERINTASICQYEGWEGYEDDLDLIKANTNVMQGSNETMATLLEYVKKADMDTDEAYQVLDDAIDINNYIDYMLMEMYTGNTDTLNVKRYRNPKTDGKWRWVLFDLDWAFYTDTNSVTRWLTPGGMGNKLRTDNTLFIACMKNSTFRDMFLTRLGEYMATRFSAENVVNEIEKMYETIKPLLPEQFERWGQTESEYKSALRDFVNYAKRRPGRMLQFLKYCDYLKLTEAQMNQYFGDIMQIEGVTYDDIKKP